MRIDPRAGSGPLLPLMKTRGVREAHHASLSYGDIHIEGRGPEGMPLNIGIEYKKLEDLIACIGNGRLTGHQVPGMLASYDVCWLLVEGIWRENRESGLIEVPRSSAWRPLPAGRGITARALEGFLSTLTYKTGVNVMRTGTISQTVDWLYHQNLWWTGKAYDEHRAHLSFDNSAAIASLVRPSTVRRVANTLPGIGYDRSAAVARHFSSVVELAMADESDWTSIPGIGKGIAKRVVEAINGVE